MRSSTFSSARRRALLAGCGLASVMLGGCGFHLQGHTPLSPIMRRPYLRTVDRQSEFVQSLRRAMITSGAQPTDDQKLATAVVHIINDKVIRQVLSTSAANTITEYTVTYTVRFSVSIGDHEVLPPEDISTTQPFSYVASLQLAKQQEEITLRQGMARDLADIVMRRLARLHPPT